MRYISPGALNIISRHEAVLQAEVWLEIAHLPWITKPLYGFVSDTFPIMGERRRPYLVICGCLGKWPILKANCMTLSRVLPSPS